MTVERMILDAEQAAELLGIARRTLWRWSRARLVPCRRLGRLFTYRRDELLRWHDSRPGTTLAQALEVDPRTWQLSNQRRLKQTTGAPDGSASEDNKGGQ